MKYRDPPVGLDKWMPFFISHILTVILSTSHEACERCTPNANANPGLATSTCMLSTGLPQNASSLARLETLQSSCRSEAGRKFSVNVIRMLSEWNTADCYRLYYYCQTRAIWPTGVESASTEHIEQILLPDFR